MNLAKQFSSTRVAAALAALVLTATSASAQLTAAGGSSQLAAAGGSVQRGAAGGGSRPHFRRLGRPQRHTLTWADLATPRERADRQTQASSASANR